MTLLTPSHSLNPVAVEQSAVTTLDRIAGMPRPLLSRRSSVVPTCHHDSGHQRMSKHQH